MKEYGEVLKDLDIMDEEYTTKYADPMMVTFPHGPLTGEPFTWGHHVKTDYDCGCDCEDDEE